MPDVPRVHKAVEPTSPTNVERPPSHKRGYDHAWRRFRLWFASVVPAICVWCSHAGPSEQMHLDHKVPLTGPDDPLRLDPNAVQWLCETCHNKKTSTEDNGFGRLTDDI